MSDITDLPIVDTDAPNELKDLAGEECISIFDEFFSEFGKQSAELELLWLQTTMLRSRASRIRSKALRQVSVCCGSLSMQVYSKRPQRRGKPYP